MANASESISVSPRPMVDKDLALSLLKKLFPVAEEEEAKILREFPSYDDRNFHVSAKLENSDERAEFVLKFMNPKVYDEDLDFLQAHSKLLVHIGKHGFRCPTPVVSRQGTLFCTVELPHSLHDQPLLHGVLLWTFVSGVTLPTVGTPPSDALLSSLGSLLADLHNCLQDLAGSDVEKTVKKRQFEWSILNGLDRLAQLPLIPDAGLQDIARSVLLRYKEEVLPRVSTLRQGIIHGDMNEMNIIVDPARPDDVAGFIDTSDTNYAPFIGDLAIAVAYISMLMPQPPAKAVSPLIRSYCDKRPLTPLEMKCLHVLVMVRQIQTVTCSYKAYSEDPGNEYLLNSVGPASTTLPQLFNTSDDDIKRWWFAE